MQPEFIYMAAVSGYLAKKHDISIECIMDIVKVLGTTTFGGSVNDYECDLIQNGTYKDLSTADIAAAVGDWCTATMVRDVLIIMRNARINAGKIETEISRIKSEIPNLSSEARQEIADNTGTDMKTVEETIKFLISE